jgi:hypothetical protein
MSEANDKPTQEAAVIAGAVKYDTGKSPIYRGAIGYFPEAIAGVATVSNFGATKYAWAGWRNVPDGLNRYTDAMVRHLVAEAKGEVLDPESGLPHSWHVAWNALARAELLSKEGNQ